MSDIPADVMEKAKLIVRVVRAREQGNRSHFFVGTEEEAVNAVTDALLSERREAEQRAWRCFHCDEIFASREDAANHFGPFECEKTACQLTADEKGIVGLLRDALAELAVYRREDNAAFRHFYALGSDHAIKERKAEEEGYAKGLADGRSLPTPSQEPTAPFPERPPVQHGDVRDEVK